ncbi:MAG TPA: acyl-CoA dehydrogenase family protein [Streptosporangiaceae bacterium]|jgi:alkylation response protein AidB-like acyl-CoA dehydrogenase
MDLTLTEEQELIQATAREVLESRYATAGARAMEPDPAGYSAALWKEMVELGWTGLALPESHGGLGAGFLEMCLVIEQTGHFQVPSPLLSTVAGCGLPIARYGTEEQRAEWLGAIARGRVMSPVPARWDRTDADVVAAESGAELALDGTAHLVPWAHAADDLLVVARLGDGLTALVVETASPGVTVEPLEAIGTDRPCRVSFDGVRVAAGRALPDGAAVDAAISAYGAAATCAELVGAAQRVLDMTVEYATQREQFGRPIGTFQAVQHHCADMAMDVLTSRFIAYEAIWRLSAEPEVSMEVSMAVSMAKAWVSEAAERVCARGHQVHGAIGFTREHDLHLYSRHAMAAALSFGDGDFHWERVAGHLDLPRS